MVEQFQNFKFISLIWNYCEHETRKTITPDLAWLVHINFKMLCILWMFQTLQDLLCLMIFDSIRFYPYPPRFFYWQSRHQLKESKTNNEVTTNNICSFQGIICVLFVATAFVHDDVIKWKHFPRYWPLVRGIHRSPVNSPHKGQWRGTVMFSLIYARINCWINNREASDLRHHRANYDVIIMLRW